MTKAMKFSLTSELYEIQQRANTTAQPRTLSRCRNPTGVSMTGVSYVSMFVVLQSYILVAMRPQKEHDHTRSNAELSDDTSTQKTPSTLVMDWART